MIYQSLALVLTVFTPSFYTAEPKLILKFRSQGPG